MARWTESDLKRRSAPQPQALTLTRTTPPEANSGEETAQIEPLPKEDPGPIRWEVATGLHAQQFGTRFRLVVVGPAGREKEVTDLLTALNAQP